MHLAMLEGKFTPGRDSRNSANGSAPEGALSELSWSELVARLSAARELRAELAARDITALASFDAESARHLAWQHASAIQVYRQPDVNSDDLDNGKGRTAEDLASSDREEPAIRGST
ncbi:hypothetical protein [Aurantiacibacter poecillastricola]|uniref:hypothetical protein n=1 Tax=Aurantiacibacter poecillastricola TaxID=3064385 RepID=UPI00273FBD2E|nr:hypothetical protein [Aurantiacibacter sp. 219JJ12-13]MDP5260447.1 hypothetical protein [Aurantiacibacter sp. 219JJ12-13]